tara:strand:- start:3 stop:317 length:315 start_codon:yes stop_codon:yes gene_type:complete
MNQFDTIRAMWEGSLEEKKELDPATVGQIASLTDRNDHNEAVIVLAKSMKEMKVVKMMELLKKMHKENGSMSSDMIAIRTGMYQELMKKSKKVFGNHDEIYKAF